MIVISYLIGSIPFGFLLTKLMGAGDIRSAGSGNIGATNVMRVLGKKAGYVTFLLDSAKGVIAVALFAGDSFADCYIIGIAAITGHCFPVWLKFKGGKGVSTALGVVAYVHLLLAPQLWWVLLLMAGLWIATFKATRTVSIASIATFIVIPIINYIIFDEILFSCTLSAIIIIRHKANIIRLVNGTENRFSK